MKTAAELRAEAEAARQEAKTQKERAEKLAADARKAEREERRAAERAESDAFYGRLYDEIGQPLAGLTPSQHAIVYGQAYRDGHSSGPSEVEERYGELAEMARQLLEHAKAPAYNIAADRTADGWGGR